MLLRHLPLSMAFNLGVIIRELLNIRSSRGLQKDRTETIDLVSKMPERVKVISDKYEKWAERVQVEP